MSANVVVGLKGAVVALDRDTGDEVWRTVVKPNFIATGGSGFVVVLCDRDRVFAHAGGELHCLDLGTGRSLWTNGLDGLGYGLATLAAPGITASVETALSVFEEKRRREQQGGAANTHVSAS